MGLNWRLNFLFIGFFIFLLGQVVFASPVQLTCSSDKNMYLVGENIKITAIVKNNTGGNLSLYLDAFMQTYSSEPFIILQKGFDLNLVPRGEKTIVFNNSVKKDFPSAMYYVEILDMQSLDGNNPLGCRVEFMVKNKPSPPPISYYVCADINCVDQRKVFVKGETAYIKASLIAPNRIDINSILIHGSKVNNLLQNYSADGINSQTIVKISNLFPKKTYEFFVQNESSFSRAIKQRINFVVIDRHAVVKNASRCNANAICEKNLGETVQSCPTDCTK